MLQAILVAGLVLAALCSAAVFGSRAYSFLAIRLVSWLQRISEGPLPISGSTVAPATRRQFAPQANCYAYARNDLSRHWNPGQLAISRGHKIKGDVDKIYTRSVFLEALRADGVRRAGIRAYWSLFRGDGKYLISVGYHRLDRAHEDWFGNTVSGDFHFIRLDNDGSWSHKPGQDPVVELGRTPRYHEEYGTCVGVFALPAIEVGGQLVYDKSRVAWNHQQ
jgi:hypothetical protein